MVLLRIWMLVSGIEKIEIYCNGQQQSSTVLSLSGLAGRIMLLEAMSPVHTCTVSSAITMWGQRAKQGTCCLLTRKRPWQRAWVRHITKRYRGWSMYHIVIGHCLSIPLHAWAQHPLANEIHCSNHKKCEDYTNDGAYRVVGLWRRLLCSV